MLLLHFMRDASEYCAASAISCMQHHVFFMRFCRYTGHTLAKFIITMVSGILTGFFAVWMSTTVGTMFEWKNGFVQELLNENGEHRVFIAYLWHAAYSCLLVSFAVALVGGMARGSSTCSSWQQQQQQQQQYSTTAK
jgi:uncharacterized membrane protein